MLCRSQFHGRRVYPVVVEQHVRTLLDRLPNQLLHLPP